MWNIYVNTVCDLICVNMSDILCQMTFQAVLIICQNEILYVRVTFLDANYMSG